MRAIATHPRPEHQGLTFRDAAAWDEFLRRYYKPVADACVKRLESTDCEEAHQARFKADSLPVP